jgi:glutaredoxin
MTVLTLYGKPGCCLCDEAREAIRTVRLDRDFELREVDVSLDPELHRRYGERIPVVEIDGQEAFELQLDAGLLRDRLGTVNSS